MKIHKRHLRLFVNAGMAMPICAVNDGPLDTDKTRWPTTGNDVAVTCRKCLRKIQSRAGGES